MKSARCSMGSANPDADISHVRCFVDRSVRLNFDCWQGQAAVIVAYSQAEAEVAPDDCVYMIFGSRHLSSTCRRCLDSTLSLPQPTLQISISTSSLSTVIGYTATFAPD